MLVDTPYPDDGIPSSSKEAVKRRVQLECIHPIAIVLLHLVSNNIGHLKHKEEGREKSSQIASLISPLFQQRTHFLVHIWTDEFHAPALLCQVTVQLAKDNVAYLNDTHNV